MRRACLILLLAGVAAPPLTAQTAPAAVRTFTPADFARFAPQNAADMLRQVPGFTIREAVQERGLGQATANVLLNGRRISGRSDDILTQLGRIPAGTVERIEVLDGASLNIQGLSGQVANVVVRAGRVSGQYAWRPEFRTNFTDPVLTRGEVSVSGTSGPIEFTLGLENQASAGGAGGPTLIFGPDGSLIETRRDEWATTFNQPRVSGRFVIDGPGSSVGNLNLSLRRFWYDFREDGVRLAPGQTDRERDVIISERGHNYEIGGDFEFAAGPGRLKLIGLQRFSRVVPDTFVRTIYADAQPDVGDRFAREGEELERVGRAEYRWRSGGADWQISGEAAFNTLDNISRQYTLDAAGGYVEVVIPGGTGRVEESRYEVIGSYARALAPNLNIQLSAGAEHSTIAQIGDQGLTRSFFRPKGQFTAAWTPDPTATVNLRLQRRVGQLNFFDFLASVNLLDDRVNAGNVELVPPQSWEVEVEGVQRFPWGTSTLRLYAHLVDDIIDTVPIGLTGESVGNLDRAIRYGAEWRTTFNLDSLGWRGARLDTRVQVQGSEVEDPLTGETRQISNSLLRFADVTFRHDVPGSDWAWGGNMNHSISALNYRLTEFGRQWEGPVWASLYVEHKNVAGLTLRATAGNLFDARSMWDRTVYVNRRNGPVSFVEARDRLIGPIFSFQVRGRF